MGNRKGTERRLFPGRSIPLQNVKLSQPMIVENKERLDDRILTANDEEGRKRPTLESHDEATKETSADDDVDR